MVEQTSAQTTAEAPRPELVRTDRPLAVEEIKYAATEANWQMDQQKLFHKMNEFGVTRDSTEGKLAVETYVLRQQISARGWLVGGILRDLPRDPQGRVMFDLDAYNMLSQAVPGADLMEKDWEKLDARREYIVGSVSGKMPNQKDQLSAVFKADNDSEFEQRFGRHTEYKGPAPRQVYDQIMEIVKVSGLTRESDRKALMEQLGLTVETVTDEQGNSHEVPRIMQGSLGYQLAFARGARDYVAEQFSRNLNEMKQHPALAEGVVRAGLEVYQLENVRRAYAAQINEVVSVARSGAAAREQAVIRGNQAEIKGLDQAQNRVEWVTKVTSWVLKGLTTVAGGRGKMEGMNTYLTQAVREMMVPNDALDRILELRLEINRQNIRLEKLKEANSVVVQ